MLVGTRSQRGAPHRPGRARSRERSCSTNIPTISCIQYFPATYPVWYSEGFAEFWGTDQLPATNDVVEVGLPAEHRFATFRDARLAAARAAARRAQLSRSARRQLFLLYAEGWLLMRYLFEHPERQRQIEQYLRLINARRHLRGGGAPAPFPTWRVQLRAVRLCRHAAASRAPAAVPRRSTSARSRRARCGPAEQALITHEIKLSQGYPAARGGRVRRRGPRASPARFPDDPFAIRLVMETERLAGNDAAALAAADRLLAIEPNNARALATKGAGPGRRACAPRGSTDAAAWTARAPAFVRADRAAPERSDRARGLL